MKNLVFESLDEFMTMSKDRNEDREERYVGNYIPQDIKNRLDNSMNQKQRKRKDAIEINDQSKLGTFKTPEELEAFEPKDTDWVVRTADNNGELILYDGDKLSKENVNMIKTAYKINQDINYIDVRPITYKEWKDLPEEYKISSRRKKE